MSARRLKAIPDAPQPVAGFTPTIWRCEMYPNYSLELPALGVTVKFNGGNYAARAAEVDAALQRLKGRKPIRRWSGVAIHRCGLCDFASTDEEEVEEHRRLSHGANVLEG
ncbi:MAG: hypothetical protein KBF28_03800 [Gemmatimonadales bacterium]|nr:hypothetical protein [Gemmatimonadales bacterium]